MIHTNRIVTVGEQECIIDRPIVLYRGDREVEIEFTLVGNEFTFSEEGNVIKSVNASHGQLVLNTPSGEHMFSELAECHEGKVVFVVTKEMIDEFIEMGFYSFQIRLYDSAEMKSRVTIPPVMNGFDIRNPIAAEDETNVVDQGIVDYARIFKDQSNEELPTFDWQGEYVKTEWAHHDVITENKMNKIEDALYSINANIKESDVVMLNALDNVKKDADKYVKEHMAEVEADVEEFERNLNTGVEQFKIDTNAAMTAHKNEIGEVIDGFDAKLEAITHKVNIKEKMSKGLTVTEAFKEAIKEAYAKSYNQTGWKSPLIIEIPSGEYVIEDTLIDSSTGVSGGRFVFKGYGYQNTKILFQPVDKKYLFDNRGVFGFTVFEGIAFQSNGLGRFMNGVGGGSGNAQGLIFEKCRFDNWDNIIYTTGNTMMSEVTFRDCRIAGGTSDTVMFHMDNPQAVNWRFIATDIESFSGIMIQLIRGTTITFLQGSIIPSNGTVISIPSSADPNTFGRGNNPCIQMYGSRFELRGRSYLVKSNSITTNAGIVFYNCGMGGFNLDTSTENPHYTLDLAMSGMIKFTNCYNLIAFKMRDVVNNSSSYISPKKIIFEDCDVDIKSFMTDSITVGAGANALGTATIKYNGHIYKLVREQPYVIPNYPLVTTLWKQNIAEPNTFGYFSKTGVAWNIEDFKYKRIYSIALIITSMSNYGNAVEVPFRITNASKSKVFLEGTFKIQSNVRFTTDETFTPYFIRSDDYLIFEIGEVLNTSASTLRFNGFIEITHQ